MKKYIIEYVNGGKVDCMPAAHYSFSEALDTLVSYFQSHPSFSFRIQE